MTQLLDAKTRAWIYGIVGAIVPLLVTLGVVTGEIAGHIMAITASMLTLGTSALAMSNVPQEPSMDDEWDDV
jgi:hypothetical protein